MYSSSGHFTKYSPNGDVTLKKSRPKQILIGLRVWVAQNPPIHFQPSLYNHVHILGLYACGWYLWECIALGIQSYCQRMIGVSNHLLSILVPLPFSVLEGD